jgi:hypothetical protein
MEDLISRKRSWGRSCWILLARKTLEHASIKTYENQAILQAEKVHARRQAFHISDLNPAAARAAEAG